jgi:hypothetical protein
VAEDEARQDEEQLHPQVTLLHQPGRKADREIGPVVIEDHPHRREKPQAGQGLDVAGVVHASKCPVLRPKTTDVDWRMAAASLDMTAESLGRLESWWTELRNF